MKQLWTINDHKALSQAKVDIFLSTLNALHERYPDVIIKEVGDFYTQDLIRHTGAIFSLQNYWGEEKTKEFINKFGFLQNPPTLEYDIEKREYENNIIGGTYDPLKRSIFINHASVRKYNSLTEYMLFRKYMLKDNGNFAQFDVLGGTTIENLVIHEFGHAIDFQYDMHNNSEMIELYESAISKGAIEIELSIYAKTDIHEFIAEGFVESKLFDARLLGKKVGELIDRLVIQGKAMSFEERLIHKLLSE